MNDETIPDELTSILEICKSWLGPTREQCDDTGQALWDRIEALQLAQVNACRYADELGTAVMEVMNGERKAGKLPTEPMVRLIHFARTGTVKNATLRRKHD